MQYKKRYESFRDEVTWLDAQPTALEDNLDRVKAKLPNTWEAVQHVNRKGYALAWVWHLSVLLADVHCCQSHHLFLSMALAWNVRPTEISWAPKPFLRSAKGWAWAAHSTSLCVPACV